MGGRPGGGRGEACCVDDVRRERKGSGPRGPDLPAEGLDLPASGPGSCRRVFFLVDGGLLRATFGEGHFSGFPPGGGASKVGVTCWRPGGLGTEDGAARTRGAEAESPGPDWRTGRGGQRGGASARPPEAGVLWGPLRSSGVLAPAARLQPPRAGDRPVPACSPAAVSPGPFCPGGSAQT